MLCCLNLIDSQIEQRHFRNVQITNFIMIRRSADAVYIFNCIVSKISKAKKEKMFSFKGQINDCKNFIDVNVVKSSTAQSMLSAALYASIIYIRWPGL